jgi:hypothetical protein
MMAAVEPVPDRLFRAASSQRRREPSDAYAANALAERAQGAGAAATATRSRDRA